MLIRGVAGLCDAVKDAVEGFPGQVMRRSDTGCGIAGGRKEAAVEGGGGVEGKGEWELITVHKTITNKISAVTMDIFRNLDIQAGPRSGGYAQYQPSASRGYLWGGGRGRGEGGGQGL